MSPQPTLHQLPPPCALLFDFDGVIADSQAAHHAAWRSAAQAFWGKAVGPYPDHLKGKSPTAIAAYYCEQYGQADQVAPYRALKLDHLLAQASPPPLLPGARALLEWLADSTLPFGIASNAPRAFVEQTLHRHQLAVPVVLGLEDYQQPKPHPEPYLRLAEALEVAPLARPAAWILEDSPTGLAAALQSGGAVIGVGSSLSENGLRSSGAQAVVPDLQAVLDVLKKNA